MQRSQVQAATVGELGRTVREQGWRGRWRGGWRGGWKGRTVGEFRLVETLGSGGYGKVWRGVVVGEEEDGARKRAGAGAGAVAGVAVKRVKVSRFASERARQARVRAVEREAVLQRACQAHPNIVSCHEVLCTGRKWFTVLDLCADGDLFDFVVAHGPLRERHARDLTGQLVSALHHMHSLNIAHCDLKPENVLLRDGRRQALVCDFGHARRWDEHADGLVPVKRGGGGGGGNPHSHGNPHAHPNLGLGPSHGGGTLRCQPPEMFVANPVTNRVEFDPKAMDVFALGNVVFFMLTSFFPFQGCNDHDTIARISAAVPSAPWPANVSRDCADFVRLALDPVLELRPTAAELLRHPFVANALSHSPKPCG